MYVPHAPKTWKPRMPTFTATSGPSAVAIGVSTNTDRLGTTAHSGAPAHRSGTQYGTDWRAPR